jgi:hypothetical protein
MTASHHNSPSLVVQMWCSDASAVTVTVLGLTEPDFVEPIGDASAARRWTTASVAVIVMGSPGDWRRREFDSVALS